MWVKFNKQVVENLTFDTCPTSMKVQYDIDTNVYEEYKYKLNKIFHDELEKEIVNTLNEEKLSQRDLVDLNLKDVIKVSEAIRIIELFLETNLSILIVLACEEQMICWLNLEVVT